MKWITKWKIIIYGISLAFLFFGLGISLNTIDSTDIGMHLVGVTCILLFFLTSVIANNLDEIVVGLTEENDT